MNDPLVKIGNMVSLLLNYDQQKIRIKKSNSEIESFKNDYIVINSFGNFITSLHRNYDANSEIETFNNYIKGSATIQFWGENALQNAVNFTNLINSQDGKDAQNKEQITFYLPKRVIDLQIEIETRFYTIYEVEITFNSLFQTKNTRFKIKSGEINFLKEDKNGNN